MKLYTIGFTRSTAEGFFSRLSAARIRTLFDVRLKTGGQLSGFAKDVDLAFLLSRLIHAAYAPLPILAPTPELLKAYRKKVVSWDEYARSYAQLLKERDAIRHLDIAALDESCLLCSEHVADRCHRRLAAEYIQTALADSATIDVVHL